MGNTHHTRRPRGRQFTLSKQPELSRALAVNNWKVWREHKGLLQEELAEKIGISRSWISRLETGEVIPDILQFMVLVQILELGASLNTIYEEVWLTIGKILKNKNS